MGIAHKINRLDEFWVLVILVTSAMLGSFLASQISYETVSVYVDILAKDGGAASFSVKRHQTIVSILSGISLFALIFVCGLMSYRKLSPRNAVKNGRLIIHFTGILLLPFCVFYWLVPVFSNVTIGNDYSGYSLHQQMELMFSIKKSTFPLFVSGFEAKSGQSTSRV